MRFLSYTFRHLCFLAFTFLLACRPEEVAPAFPLDSVVLVEIKEVQVANKKHVILSCQTKKDYPCSNYFIKSVMRQAASNVVVEFLEVGSDRLCTTSLGPARADLDLGPLAKGQYQVNLNYQQANQGTLTVSDATIRLEIPQPKGIEIVNPVYNR
jgi:hypothetical protein